MKTRGVVIGLLALSLVTGSAAQNAAARKSFAETVRQKVIKDTRYPVPSGFNLTADGPDATFYVYHASEVTSYDCITMLTEDFVSKMRELGFTKVVCTNDKETTFILDPIAQTPAAVRKSFAQTVLQKDMASNPVPGYFLGAEGPDATWYVYHWPGITSDTCRSLLAGGASENLQKNGFTQLVCTGDGNTRFAFDLLTQQQSQQPSSLSNARPPVAAQPALPVNANPPALTQTPSVSVTKPISEYMRNVGLLYIETVERPSSVEQLQTLRALEDRIDIQTITQANKEFYERGLKRLGHLAEIRLSELQTRLAGIQSREAQAREVSSNANRELDNILERNRTEERDYSQGLITTKAYKAYLEDSMALLRQKQSEARTASETLVEQEKLSQQNGSSTPYVGCDNSLRRMIKAGEYDIGELENDCELPAPQLPAPALQQQLLRPCPAGMTLKTTSYGTICEASQQQTPQTLRQTIVTNTNAQLQKEQGPAYAEITGDTLILHIKPMTASTFQAIFSSPEFQQFTPTMKQAGLGTLTYTNDANLLFVYDVNAGQLVVGSPATVPSKECTKATEFAAKYTRTYSNRDDCPRCSSLSQAQRNKRQAMLKAQMDAAESGRIAVCSAKTTAEAEQNWMANVENENRLLTEYRDWLISTIGNP